MSIFPRKNWVPEWCKSEKFMCTIKFMYTPPNKKVQNHREPPYKLCLKKACLLCSPPSSTLVMGSLFSFGSPIVDIHMVKTLLGTAVPRSPESNAPISSLYAPPHFPRNQPVLATYSGQNFLSFSFFFLLQPLRVWKSGCRPVPGWLPIFKLICWAGGLTCQIWSGKGPVLTKHMRLIRRKQSYRGTSLMSKSTPP